MRGVFRCLRHPIPVPLWFVLLFGIISAVQLIESDIIQGFIAGVSGAADR